jgi:molybdate transport system regulatory protein
MNKCFREPLVVSARGGTKGGGGAHLTETGNETLALYRRMEEESLKSVQPEWQKFQKLIKI